VSLRFEYWDTLRHKRAEVPWLIEGVLPKGVVGILAHRPASGALEFAVGLAAAVATGREFAGAKVEKGTVLWLEGVKSKPELEEILKTIPPDFDNSPMRWVPDFQNEPRVGAIQLYVSYGPTFLDKFEPLSELQSAVKEHEAALVIINNLTSYTQRKTRVESTHAQLFMRDMKDFAANTGATVLLIHHLSIFQGRVRAADHYELSTNAHVLFTLELGRDARKQRLLRFEAIGCGNFPSSIHFLAMPEPMIYKPANPEDEPIPVGTIKERVWERLNEVPKTVTQLANETGAFVYSLQNVLHSLVRQGLAVRGPKKRKQYTYLRADLKRF
jgi:hypothetical protein